MNKGKQRRGNKSGKKRAFKKKENRGNAVKILY
jgi:hypothetical protein